MENYIHDPYHANMIGAKLVQEGKYELAIAAFRQGIVLLSKANSNAHSSKDPSLIAMLSCSLCSVEVCSRKLFGERLIVYNRALIFSKTPELALSSSHGIAFVYAILSFNIGLAHHCWGMKHQSKASLLNACTFYEMSYQMFQYIAPFSEFNMQIMVPVLNNLCHISHECQDFQKCRSQGNLLRSLATFLQVSEMTCNIINSEDINEIFLNTFFLNPPVAAAIA